jgi:predicted transcriptional regulator
MSTAPFDPLSRRERQIMDALHNLGRAGVAEVLALLPHGASYDSVRVTLGILERKGHVSHTRAGRRYVYTPAERTERARSRAVRHLLRTFFHDSAPRAVSSLLDASAERLTDRELDELAALVERARRKKKIPGGRA